MTQKIKMIDTVIPPGVAYSFYAVPYSTSTIKKLDDKILRAQKTACGLPKCLSNITTQLSHELYGLDAFFLKNNYLRCIGEQLLNALNDKGSLGIIYKGLLHLILAKYGGSNNLPRIRSFDCYQSPITRTLFLLKTMDQVQLKSALDNFLHEPAPLETIWLHEAQTLPNLNP